MFLSLLSLNPRNRGVQKEQQQPYELHRTVLRAFPAGSVNRARNDGDSNGVLFRLDEDLHTHFPIVLVQSRYQPDWAWLEQSHDARQQPYLLLPVQTMPFQIAFQEGQRLAFRLRANPTKRLDKSAAYDKGKRIGIYDVNQQIEWFERKADHNGFSLLQVQTSRDEKIRREEAIPVKTMLYEDSSSEQLKTNADDQSQKQKHKLELFSVQFDGILRVTDPAAFLTAVQSGIGCGKAFGFGLLSLAPVR